MSLDTAVTRLNSALADRYLIEREVGQGGMATVYLAHDVRHDRKVALKVLRPELAAILGGERFLKEIRTTANLQHPHILSLFDSGEADGLVFYVMPYVEGESLRDRLNREKQLPVDQAVRIATEVAGALDYAHRHGVVHRDIKPENILLHEGQALVADFGIALAASRSEGGTRMTETGMSLGTPHYMAPEQAMGEREITSKADIYALGCVVYEMLTGEPPFTGPTAQAIVARVMTDQPRSITAQRRTVPPHVEAAVGTALEKLPADRFASGKEFAEALAGRGDGGTGGRTIPSQSRPPVPLSRRPTLLVAALVLLAAGALAARFLGRPAAEIVALQIAPAADHRLGASYAGNLAVSPDGHTIAYIGQDADARRIRIRRLDSFEEVPVSGTQGVFADPVFSPDGHSLVFTHDDGTVRRIDLTGGQTSTLAGNTNCCTLQWTPEGVVFSTSRGLEIVSPSGGQPRVLAPIGFPSVGSLLPGGDAVVYLDFRGSRLVQIMDVKSGRTTPLEGVPTGVTDLAFADGYLFVQIGTNLLAAPLDVGGRRLRGEPRLLLSQVRAAASGGFLESQSAIGGPTLAFVPASGSNRMVVVERGGRETVLPETTGTFHRPRFSPDGRRIAMDVSRPEGRDVWVYDFDQSTMTRVSFQPNGHDAIWALDGRSVIYSAAASDTILGIYSRRVDGSGGVDTISTEYGLDAPEAVLADGGMLAYAISPRTHTDAWVVKRGGTHRAVLEGDFDETAFALSPDGHWLAYVTDESGRREVYLRPMDGGSRIQVSTSGGREPRWAPDGHQLFYRTHQGGIGARLLAARLVLPAMRVAGRDTLFAITDYEESDPHANYDISPRGDRFVFIRQQMPNEIRVIRNWRSLLQK